MSNIKNKLLKVKAILEAGGEVDTAEDWTKELAEEIFASGPLQKDPSTPFPTWFCEFSEEGVGYIVTVGQGSVESFYLLKPFDKTR
jgi:hypothetical protein